MKNSKCKTCEGKNLCCSQKAHITTYEAKRLKNLGAFIGRESAKYYLNPNNEICKFLINDRCSIYQCRPKSCIDFTCELEGNDEWMLIEQGIRVGEFTDSGNGSVLLFNPHHKDYRVVD